jgi:hypothetical protein
MPKTFRECSRFLTEKKITAIVFNDYSEIPVHKQKAVNPVIKQHLFATIDNEKAASRASSRRRARRHSLRSNAFQLICGTLSHRYIHSALGWLPIALPTHNS